MAVLRVAIEIYTKIKEEGTWEKGIRVAAWAKIG